jgi:pimeloyl-ACP methyl ester carboxylesterase
MTTFVLIHGAYQGGWIWKPTVEQLLAKGHRVFAPTLDGCAERKGQVRAGITTETHAAEIADLLFYEDLKDVVLAGTSTGGMVMARAAELARERGGTGRVRRCAGADERRGAARHRQAPDRGQHRADQRAFPAGFREPPFRRPRSGHAALGDRALHHASDRGHDASRSSSTLLGPVVECLGDLVQAAAPIRRSPISAALRAAEGRWHELDTGHYPMLSEPAALARLIAKDDGHDRRKKGLLRRSARCCQPQAWRTDEVRPHLQTR